jgi:hypothetical protein
MLACAIVNDVGKDCRKESRKPFLVSRQGGDCGLLRRRGCRILGLDSSAVSDAQTAMCTTPNTATFPLCPMHRKWECLLTFQTVYGLE